MGFVRLAVLSEGLVPREEAEIAKFADTKDAVKCHKDIGSRIKGC